LNYSKECFIIDDNQKLFYNPLDKKYDMGVEFRNILVPYDDSPNSKRALKKAFTLAELSNGTITLVHVISYHKAVAKIIEPYKESMIGHVKKFFNKIGHDASKRDINLKTQILYGSPSDEILGFMKNKKFDVVIMGRRGVTKITGPSLGSVSNALVQNSKTPILIVM
jgi:nucleotide-binding universal stress UspA family protein